MKAVELPSGWVSCKLGDITTKPQYGWTTKATNKGDNLKLLRTSDISSGRVNWQTVPICANEPGDPKKYFLKAGDIVVSRAGSVGKSFLIREDVTDAVFASYLVRLTPYISSGYIDFFMKSWRYWEQIEDKSSGIAVPNVNASKLSQIELDVAPLAEQHRIVEKIENLFRRLDKGEEELCKVHKTLSIYRQSILKEAFAGRLVPQDPDDEPASELLKRIANKKAQLIKEKKIKSSRYQFEDKTIESPFEIPESWQWCRLGSIGAITGGGTPPTANSANFAKQGEGIPWLTPADLSNYRSLYIERGSRDLSEKGLQSSSATVMPAGTVLFTSRAPIGYIAIAANPITTNQGFKSIVPYIIDCSHFIALAMQTFASDIESASSGTTFKEAAGRVVSAFAIPFPPLAEQRRIVEKVETLFAHIDKLEEEIDNAQKLIAHFRQSILKNAFTGRLVPQNSNDEPAIKLFARIQKIRSVATDKR